MTTLEILQNAENKSDWAEWLTQITKEADSDGDGWAIIERE